MRPIRVAGLLVFLLLGVAMAAILFYRQTSIDSTPNVIRVGVLPDESDALLRQRYQSLIGFLSDQTGLDYELVIPATYSELVDQFGGGHVDLAYFGGLTFLVAEERYGAIPVVMRDVDVRFQSHFIARNDAKVGGDRIVDFKGESFAFGSNLSTSGHLMPRFFLKQEGIDPERFFSEVIYSGAHDKTAEAVVAGTVDLGAANRLVIDKMFADGRLDPSVVRVVWTTPPYPDYVWAISRQIPHDLRDTILDAFLLLGPADKDHKLILDHLGAAGFLPAVPSDFQELRRVAEGQGLL